MRLRPLNDTVIIEPDLTAMAVDDSQVVLDAVNRGLIIIPEKNTVLKISNKAKVVSYGPRCDYKFTTGQEIIYNQFADTPVWVTIEDQRYRLIKYHYVSAVYE